MIRKVLLSTINYDHPQAGMLQAFGGIFGAQNISDYDFLELKRRRQGDSQVNEGLLRVAKEFQPDWIWLQLQETGIIKPNTIMQLRSLLPKCVISTWNGDLRPSVGAYVGATVKACHLTLISNAGQIKLFQDAGAERVRYCQVGLDFIEDVQGMPAWNPPFRVPDVVFCANYYGASFPGSGARLSGVRALKSAGIDIGVVGKGWPSGTPVMGRCQVKQQYSVYQKAKVVLSINNFNNVELFYSDRHLAALASGTPLVTRYIPGLEKEFYNGVHCLWFHDDSEMTEYIKTLLGDDQERKRIGSQGRWQAIRNHTWFSRILDLIPVVEEISSTL